MTRANARLSQDPMLQSEKRVRTKLKTGIKTKPVGRTRKPPHSQANGLIHTMLMELVTTAESESVRVAAAKVLLAHQAHEPQPQAHDSTADSADPERETLIAEIAAMLETCKQ